MNKMDWTALPILFSIYCKIYFVNKNSLWKRPQKLVLKRPQKEAFNLTMFQTGSIHLSYTIVLEEIDRKIKYRDKVTDSDKKTKIKAKTKASWNADKWKVRKMVLSVSYVFVKVWQNSRKTNVSVFSRFLWEGVIVPYRWGSLIYFGGPKVYKVAEIEEGDLVYFCSLVYSGTL